MCAGSPFVAYLFILLVVSSTDQSVSSYSHPVCHFSVLAMLFMSFWSGPCLCRDHEGKTIVLMFPTEISDPLEAVSWAQCESGDETCLSRLWSSWPGPRCCIADPLPLYRVIISLWVCFWPLSFVPLASLSVMGRHVVP